MHRPRRAEDARAGLPTWREASSRPPAEGYSAGAPVPATMVWPFTNFWGRSSKAAVSPEAKKSAPARKAPGSPADPAMIKAWEGRTVAELRTTLDEVGWDSESLDRLLARVGAPDEPAKTPKPAARTPASAKATPASGAKAKRARALEDDEDEDEDEEDDEEFDISPQRRKKAAKAAGAKTPTTPRSPAVVSADISAMSPRQLKSEFERLFGYPTKSGNTQWLRRKLDAMKKARACIPARSARPSDALRPASRLGHRPERGRLRARPRGDAHAAGQRLALRAG